MMGKYLNNFSVICLNIYLLKRFNPNQWSRFNWLGRCHNGAIIFFVPALRALIIFLICTTDVRMRLKRVNRPNTAEYKFPDFHSFLLGLTALPKPVKI